MKEQIKKLFSDVKDAWNKVSVIVAVPLGLGFIVLVVFGQLCVNKLPYLIC